MAGRLRILTANLWNGNADGERFAELLEREEVDVACLQEVAPEQVEPIARVLGNGGIEPARDFTGMGIALRRPAEVASLPLRYRDVRAARLDPKDWPGLCEPLAVWNVHVRAPHSFPHHVSWTLRRAQVRGLVEHLRGRAAGPRLLLMGDFNATPLWPAYRRVAREIGDAALAVSRRTGGRPARTWGPLVPGAPRLRLLRIDHAFARGVEVEAVRCLEIPGSDHDALCLDVALV